jgi:hypothetical protein
MHLWRKPFQNPIRGLTLERLNRQLESFEAGYLADFARTADAMENRDDLLKNVITKRKKAITRHGWEILLANDSPEAREQSAALEYFYRHLTCSHAVRQDETGGFPLLIYQMMDATAKGYAVHEILWQPLVIGRTAAPAVHAGASPARNSRASSVPSVASLSSVIKESPAAPRHDPHRSLLTAHLKFVPLWYFEATTGRLRYLATPDAREGEPMQSGDWLVTTGDALMTACARAFLFKNQPLQAWLDYALNFGIPGLRATTDATRNTPDWDAMEDTLHAFTRDLSVVTNNSENIDVIDLKGRGDAPFDALIERMDRLMAALWRGADLSTLSRSQGYGASLQDQEARLLEEDDARGISDQLNATLDRWVINHLFGANQPLLARIKILVTPRDATAQDLQIDEFLIRHGARLSIEDALERYGRAAANPGQPALELPDAARPAYTPVEKHNVTAALQPALPNPTTRQP